MGDTGEGEKADGEPGIDIYGIIGTSNPMGASWEYAYQPVVSHPVAPRWVDMTGPVTVNLDRPSVAWIDDPWYDLRPEQAWRAGWEAAKAQATRLAGQVPIPEDCAAIEAHGRLSAAMDAAHAISAMDPPS